MPPAARTAILLWCDESGGDARLDAATAQAIAGERLAVQRCASLAEAIGGATAAGLDGRPATLLFAPASGFDAGALRALARAAPGTACVLVADTAEATRLQRSLPFLAPAGGRWHVEATGPALAERLAMRLDRLHRQERLRTTLDRINLQLTQPAMADPVEQRRLVASDLFHRSLLDNASDAIVSIDDHGAIQAWNRAAARLFHVEARDAMGRPFAALFEDAPEVARRLAECMDGGSAREEFAMRAGGTRHLLETTIDGVRDERARPIGVIAILRDVTAHRAAERELADSAQQKDRFLAMLAHELRNPLAPIRNAAEILQRSASADVRVGRIADIVARQVAHLSSLVDNLLDVSRVTRGVVAIAPQLVAFEGIVRDAREQVDVLLQAKRQVLVVDLQPGMHARVDRERMVQVLANVLQNAAKYSGPNAQVHLTAAVEGAAIEIVVADEGMGIAPDLLPRVFQLFAQGQPSADRAQGGLGIGLALVKELVELHGGSVTAASPGTGLGSTFTIRLPHVEDFGPSAGARDVSAGQPGP